MQQICDSRVLDVRRKIIVSDQDKVPLQNLVEIEQVALLESQTEAEKY